MTTHTIVQALPLNRLFSIRLPRINWRTLLLLSFCSFLFLSIFYVFQVITMINSGYLIKGYQKKMSSLINENKKLEVNLAQISYLENIQKRTEELNFEKTRSIKYIQILDNSLAKK